MDDAVGSGHPYVPGKYLGTQRDANIIHTLAQCFFGRDASGNAKGIFIKPLTIIKLMDGLIIRLSHGQQPDIGKEDIAIFNLML